MSVSDQELQPRGVLATLEALTPNTTQWVQGFSEALAYSAGYALAIAVSSELATSETDVNIIDQKIQVQISRTLLARAEAEDTLDFLGFNVLHELGHVKRYMNKPPLKVSSPKDAYFDNIVDDIAINYDAAKQTRFVADITKTAYDKYLFPVEKRTAIPDEPKHKQFMDALLLLAMTTSVHTKPQDKLALASMLDEIQLENLDPLVTDKLGQVVSFIDAGTGKSFNLLQQIREHGEDMPYYNQVTAHIRGMYEDLYNEDTEERQEKSKSSGDQGNNKDFDYSDSGGCQHAHTPQTESGPATDKSSDNAVASNETDDNGTLSINIPDLGRAIGAKIAETVKEGFNSKDVKHKPQQLTAEQLAKLRTELGLDESDFKGYLAMQSQYGAEIAAIRDMLLQFRRERQNDFLAPSHEVSGSGHRIHIGKLLGYLASGTQNPHPEIWKTPDFREHVEYEFDGIDFFFLCDVSQSMAGEKAQQAAASAVVLAQGIQEASNESYGDEAPVRIQIQAFGAGDETLCKLTDSPSLRDRGRMYAALSKPTSDNTQVAGALKKVIPEENRLSIVVVISDGQFHDELIATSEGKKLEEKNAIILQCIFGDAEVAKLSDNAKKLKLENARSLPNHLFGLVPEMIEALQRSTNA